jgi:hypothetical protein
LSDADHLDELFGRMAEACRAWLLAWTELKAPPSMAKERQHDRLIDAHNAVERLVDEINAVFEEAV